MAIQPPSYLDLVILDPTTSKEVSCDECGWISMRSPRKVGPKWSICRRCGGNMAPHHKQQDKRDAKAKRELAELEAQYGG